MKKFIALITLVIFAAIPGVVMAGTGTASSISGGGVVVVDESPYVYRDFTITAYSGDGSYSALTLTIPSTAEQAAAVKNSNRSGYIDGVIAYASVNPGAVAPTDGFDVSVWNENNESIFKDSGTPGTPVNDGLLADLSATNTVTTPMVAMANSTKLTVVVENNSVASAVFVLRLYYTQNVNFTPASSQIFLDPNATIAVTASTDAPVTYTINGMTFTTISDVAISPGGSYTPEALNFDLSKTEGIVTVQLEVDDSGGCVTTDYGLSNDGLTYYLPADADPFHYTGLYNETKIMNPAIKAGGWIEIGFNNTSLSGTATITATVGIR